MTEQWQELKETIIELRDSDGTGTQQEVCKFLVNYMDILEEQMQEPKTGHWIRIHFGFECSNCYECIEGKWDDNIDGITGTLFCPNCGAHMKGGE